jgi:hypothetical protein
MVVVFAWRKFAKKKKGNGKVADVWAETELETSGMLNTEL